MFQQIEIHLVYASVVCIAAWLVTSLPRGTAGAKYWIWTATSLNFLLPLSLVPGRFWPARVGWFTSRATADLPIGTLSLAQVLLVVWLAGAVVMLTRLALHIHRSAAPQSPAVQGFVRPRIVIPAGVDELLSRGELDAVLIHEATHAKRRDNLVGLLHEIAVCVFWFHPLVWFAGSRLARFRELSCDEVVAQQSRADSLVSALAKLAVPDEPSLVQANATSFIALRVERLAEPRRHSRAADIVLAVVFAAIFLSAVAGPPARAAAAETCARVHAASRR